MRKLFMITMMILSLGLTAQNYLGATSSEIVNEYQKKGLNIKYMKSEDNSSYLLCKNAPGDSESFFFMNGTCSMQVITRPYSELPNFIEALNAVKVSSIGNNDWIIKYGSTLYQATLKTTNPNYFMIFMTFTTEH